MKIFERNLFFTLMIQFPQFQTVPMLGPVIQLQLKEEQLNRLVDYTT
jgi:hypothetical protein